MIEQKSWAEFRNTGMLWWINNALHIFGWSIVVETDDTSGAVINAYPARVKFRGFAEESNDKGYRRVSDYMADNAKQLRREAYEEDTE